MQGIYRILNLITNMWYVGSASDIGKRWKDHKRDLRNGNANPYLQNAFNKYGAENFILEILMEVKGSREEVFAKEQEYLDEWMSTGQLYNLSSMARGSTLSGKNNGMYGKLHTEEWKRGQSKRSSGENNYWYGKDRSGKNNPFYGKHHTEKSCIKIGKGIAKPYSAFYNIKTSVFIPAGINLKEMCRKKDLDYTIMSKLKTGSTKRSHSGWSIMAENEICIEGILKESVRGGALYEDSTFCVGLV